MTDDKKIFLVETDDPLKLKCLYPYAERLTPEELTWINQALENYTPFLLESGDTGRSLLKKLESI